MDVRVVVLGLNNKYLIEQLIDYYETIDSSNNNNNYGESIVDELSWHSNSDKSSFSDHDDHDYNILINGYLRRFKTLEYLPVNNIILLIKEYYISSLVKSYKIRINNIIYDIWNLNINNHNKLYLSHCKKAVGIIVIDYKQNECKKCMEKTKKSIKSILTMNDNKGNNIYVATNDIGHKLIKPYYHHWFNMKTQNISL